MREGVRKGGWGRRQQRKHGGGMQNRVDKSRGIETRITEAFAKVRPTDPFVVVFFTEAFAKVRPTDPFVSVCMFTPRHTFQLSIKF